MKIVYDGCHKIYLTKEEELHLIYTKGYDINDIYPMEDLGKIWMDSCPLRFISTWDLEHQVVRQNEYISFKEILRRIDLL